MQTQPAPILSLSALGLIILLSLLWGGSFFFIAVAVEALPVFLLVDLRVGIGALAILIIMRVQSVTLPVQFDVWKTFLMMGILNNMIPFSLIMWGQTMIASSLASILNATTPIFTVLIAHFLTQDEKLNKRRIMAVFIAFLGVILIMNDHGDATPNTHLAGYLAILGAAISYGFAFVYAKRFKAMQIQPLQVAFGQLSTAFLLLLPLTLIIDEPWQIAMPDLSVWGVVATLGVFSTAFAYVLYFKIISEAGAGNLSLVTMLVPLSAVILGVFFLGETLLWAHIGGMILVLLSLLMMNPHLLKSLPYNLSKRRK
ncbi:MAG: DMT family transporter [Pseudomonadota bacterium]